MCHFIASCSVRLPLLIGMKPNKADLEYLLRIVEKRCLGPDMSILQAIVSHSSEVEQCIERNDEIKKKIFENDAMMLEKPSMAKEKEEWSRVLIHVCHDRIVDIAMIFVEFPALIIVEFCVLDQPWLKTIEERFL